MKKNYQYIGCRNNFFTISLQIIIDSNIKKKKIISNLLLIDSFSFSHVFDFSYKIDVGHLRRDFIPVGLRNDDSSILIPQPIIHNFLLTFQQISSVNRSRISNTVESKSIT